ncbi:MAG: 3-hydroxylacyl-ACP dehydratase [Steroidobacteraceae bacterium]
MRLNRGWIESHIPHRGRMCLLDEVLDWETDRIRCASGGHGAPDHPLRAHGRLGIACGIEIAAQTMAVHGALSAAGTTPRVGLLAGVRNVHMYAARLDDVRADLICEATRMAGDAGTALYEFELSSAGSPLIRGRATVLLDASNPRARVVDMSPSR